MKTTIPKWISEPTLPITITVIGAGGTGSLFLTHLARLTHALYHVTGKKVMVTVVDGDKVKKHNIGRQGFFDSDSGLFKAQVLTTRVNRAFGTAWLGINEFFQYTGKGNLTDACEKYSSNIIVSCTDNVKSRKEIHNFVKAASKLKNLAPEWKPIFWVDLGNTKTTGNVIVGSPEMEWPSIIDLYGKSLKDVKSEPSCSLAMSLNEQDLFINPFCATIGAKWVWECLSQDDINWRGAFVNLDNLTMQKIKV